MIGVEGKEDLTLIWLEYTKKENITDIQNYNLRKFSRNESKSECRHLKLQSCS